jgi:hypothetical protein
MDWSIAADLAISRGHSRWERARMMLRSFVGVTFLLSLVSTASAEPAPNCLAHDGRHDFDQRVGDWKVHHRRLKESLAGSHDWVEFDGTLSLRPVLGGMGNVSDNLFNMPSGAYRGVSMRAYDPKTGQWATWWLDGRDPHSELDPPMKGCFETGGGNGTFYGDETFKGKPIRVRVIWSHVTPSSARWEQAFSADGGKTWEVNWTSEFRRVP